MAILGATEWFATPPLAEPVIEELKALALATATHVIKRSQHATVNNAAWSHVSSENGLRVFKGHEPLGALGGSNFLHCGQLQVCASLDQVVELLRTDTPAHATAYKQRFGKDIMGTSTLYLLEAPTADTPTHRIAITWLSFQSPMKNVVMNRDAIVLECHREFTIQGRRGWVRAVRSVELPGCPNLEASCGLVRMQNHGSGHVFLESLDQPGFLDMSYVTQVDMGVGGSEWAVDAFRSRDFLVEKAIVRRCQSLLEIERYLKGDTSISNQDIPGNVAMTARSRKALRRHCCLCDKRFGPLSKKISCTQCPLAMCRQCDREWRLKSQTSESMCASCALGMEGQRGSQGQSAKYTPSPGQHRWNSETAVGSQRESVGSCSSVDEYDADSARDLKAVAAVDELPRRCYQPSVVYKGNCYDGQGFVLMRTSASTPVVYDRIG